MFEQTQINSFSDYLQIERNMIVVTVFILIMNPTEFRLVHNQKENSHYDHIPINLKVFGNLFLRV